MVDVSKDVLERSMVRFRWEQESSVIPTISTTDA